MNEELGDQQRVAVQFETVQQLFQVEELKGKS